MFKKIVDHFHEILLSVYLYNEYRGYSKLEDLLEAIKKKYPEEKEFQQAVQKHIDDERRHYNMFKGYFNRKKKMPFLVGPSFGYVDNFIRLVFRCSIENLDEESILQDEQEFFKLCRLIMMTEQRGHRQVKALLKNRLVKKDPKIIGIFKIVENDEPDHYEPYRKWLKKNNRADRPSWREKAADLWIHWTLMLIKFPVLYMNFFSRRLKTFPA